MFFLRITIITMTSTFENVSFDMMRDFVATVVLISFSMRSVEPPTLRYSNIRVVVRSCNTELLAHIIFILRVSRHRYYTELLFQIANMFIIHMLALYV